MAVLKVVWCGMKGVLRERVTGGYCKGKTPPRLVTEHMNMLG